MRSAAAAAPGQHEAVLAQHAAAVAAKLEHSDRDVRLAVVQVLGEHEAVLAQHAAAVAAKLEDSDDNVRRTAVEVLGQHEAVLAQHADAVAPRLEDSDDNVRRAAVEMLGKHEVVLAQHAAAVAAKLEGRASYVRRAAVEVLGKHEAVLAQHAAAVAAKLEDSDDDVRSAAVDALGKHEAVLAQNAAAVAAKLKDSDGRVRRAAVEALGNHEAVLAQHAAAVAAKLEDPNRYVRRAAVEALGKHEAVLAQHAAAVAAKLEDSDRDVAVHALGKLNLADHPAAVAIIEMTAASGRLSNPNNAKAIDGLQGLLDKSKAALPHIAEATTATCATPASSWGAAPTTLGEWTRPAELKPTAPLVAIFGITWKASHGGVAVPEDLLWRTYDLLAPAGQKVLEALVASIRGSEASSKVLKSVFEQEQSGSLANYRAQLDRVLKDPNCDEYLQASKALNEKLAPRRAECKQTEADFPKLIGHAQKCTRQFDAFVKMLLSKTGGSAQAAPLKGPWRALEKMVLRPAH